MSEPKLVSPMLDGFALGGSISDHNGVRCYPAMRQDSDERYIVKTISIPASQVQLDALLLTGAYPHAEAARNYFKDLANGIRSEIQVLDKLASQRGFLPCLNHQIVPMEDAVGYDIYLLSPYRLTLERYLRHHSMTHLGAVNMGIDLCAALAVARENGYLYVDLKPENIILSGEQSYHIADLGFISLSSLKYASLPDRYRSSYTAPEIADAFSTLNTTMDTYALGLVLYLIFNNGELPTEDARLKGTFEPPVYADPEMAEIILRAVSPDPEQRWADPQEMGKALISYMQRNTVNDVPIGPEEPEEEPPAESESETEESSEPEKAASEEDASEETAETSGEDAPEESEETAEESEDNSQEKNGDWIDVMDSILAEHADTEVSDESEPSLRELLGNADAAADADPEKVSEETAGILDQVQELIDHETPDPVVAPEPIDVPIPDPIPLEESEKSEEDTAEDDSVFSDVNFAEIKSAALDEDAEDEPEPEPIAPQKPKTPSKAPQILKKLLKTLVVLLIIAGIAAGGWYYYQEMYLQHINAFSVSGEADQMVVHVDTDADPSLLTVICKDTYGNQQTAALVDGNAIFTQLKPASQYTVSLEISGFHELTGMTPATYSTPERTQIMNLAAVTGAEDGSVLLNFAVEGPESKEWILSYATEGEEPQSISFTGHSVTVNNLTIGKRYTFTVNGHDDIYLIGDSSIVYNVSDVVLAQNLVVSGYRDTSLSASWEIPEGVTVESWTARCYNEDGYDQVVQIQGPNVTFNDINPDSGYTIEVTAQGMTQSTRIFVTPNPITIVSVVSNVTDDSIDISWDYDGKTPDSGWLVLYTVDGSTEQLVLQSEEPNVTISPIAPGSHYDITVQTADATSVFGGSGQADVPALTGSYRGYGLSADDIRITLYRAPDKDYWTHKDVRPEDQTTTFQAGSDMAMVWFTSDIYEISGDYLQTLVVIRDSEGRLAAVDSSTRTWDDMWENGYCEVEFEGLPSVPGNYTVEIYLNRSVLANLDITIVE